MFDFIKDKLKRLRDKSCDSSRWGFVKCTCGCSPEEKDRCECLYISAELTQTDGKELLVEVWDWRGEKPSSTFLYLNKQGTDDLIKLLSELKEQLK